MQNEILTYHASPDRSDELELTRQKKVFEDLPQLSFFLDSVPTVYLVLNSNRQIVYANRTALKTLGCNSIDELLGKRPGEALNCVHASEMPAGCGTSEACQHCGAVNAIIIGLNSSAVKECRITSENSENHFDLRIWTNPYIVKDEHFVIFSVADISDEKRRNALERIFFHDVLNTAGGIKGISELIHSFPEEVTEFKDLLFDSSNHLIQEIQGQRDLRHAENNDLTISLTKLNTKKIVDFLVGFYSNHEISKNKIIVSDSNAKSIDFVSDESLLMRVLSNMTKNAIEASKENQSITLGCMTNDDSVVFYVHNPNFMPRNIQLQIFQRSFSTKGAGRGLGTYSMKLLSEKYLKGKVYFKTDETEGTTFFAKYPINFEML